MKNRLLVTLTQTLPTRVRKGLERLRRPKAASGVSVPPFLPGIRDHLPGNVSPRRALVALRPDIWIEAKRQYPNIQLYNHHGFVFSLVKALNEAGFVVDLVDSHSGATFSDHYDLFVGHGGHCQWILDRLPDKTPVYQYISGLYWRAFDRESDERYDRFFSSRGLQKPLRHRRSITNLIDGLESLNRRADVLFTIHCPRMAEAYGPYAGKFQFTGLGAYLDQLFLVNAKEKDFDIGRKNFIYVGGTSGNLQKGLDLFLEAFAKTPDLHLYIYCKVEEEIHNHCHKELSCPNIHYIYHWRYRPFHNRLKHLLQRTNFTVHAPINTGLGTAFSATLGAGLIPVGYVDLPEPYDHVVLADSWSVDSIVECIRDASARSSIWCEEASKEAVQRYKKHCDPETVEKNFRAMFEAVPAISPRQS
jgi:glycosyltransferase involved in cell wall biosynthesis